MNDLDIPIFKKAYDLYLTFYQLRQNVSKQDRYTIWQRGENLILDILEGIASAGQTSKDNKLVILERVSRKLNVLRIVVRLAKDVKAIDNHKYLHLENLIDDIGRMLGGWIKSMKAPPSN
ncbi:diversity-generating retroelement protein Avd [Candidatus Saccharibacteria bacterium]|nr:diversity-generating retroelement protein Avd [Candidatus Saccharibacteria bacterium]